MLIAKTEPTLLTKAWQIEINLFHNNILNIIQDIAAQYSPKIGFVIDSDMLSDPLGSISMFRTINCNFSQGQGNRIEKPVVFQRRWIADVCVITFLYLILYHIHEKGCVVALLIARITSHDTTVEINYFFWMWLVVFFNFIRFTSNALLFINHNIF